MADTPTITRIRLSISTAYLIRHERPVLVDTGAPGDLPRLTAALAAAGVAPADLALVIHTHGHADHVGSSAALRPLTTAPFAIHVLDDFIARSGSNPPSEFTSMEARILLPFVNKPFSPVHCDLLVREEISLAPYGVAGRVIFTPGHTDGSISLWLENGDVIAGDALIGGALGGKLQGSRPKWPYTVTSRRQLLASVRRILAFNPRQIYVGHGGPLAPGDVARWLEQATSHAAATKG